MFDYDEKFDGEMIATGGYLFISIVARYLIICVGLTLSVLGYWSVLQLQTLCWFVITLCFFAGFTLRYVETNEKLEKINNFVSALSAVAMMVSFIIFLTHVSPFFKTLLSL